MNPSANPRSDRAMTSRPASGAAEAGSSRPIRLSPPPPCRTRRARRRRELQPQDVVVVLANRAEAFRYRLQPARLRRQILRIRVGAAHDQREPLHAGRFDLVLLDHGIKGALGAVVAELDIRHIEGDAALAFGNSQDLVGFDEDELGGGVDETADQPGAGDPVDLDSCSGDVLHGVLILCCLAARTQRAAASASGPMASSGNGETALTLISHRT